MVRRFAPVALFLAATACGEAAAKPGPAAAATSLAKPAPRNATAIAETPAEIVSKERAPLVGALERPVALRRFFEAMARLESGRAQEDVRVVQFGDSHTAADVETAQIRRAMQARFGDGGRGFVPIGRPWKHYFQEGIRVGMTPADWSQERTKAKGHGDGLYGLAGFSLATHTAGARAWTDITAKTSRAEIAYLEQPNGGAFDVLVDGVRVVRIATRGERTVSAYRSFDVLETSAHQLEVRSVGDGDVRVFGVALDRAQHGVVYDALGIGGAQVHVALTWNEPHWAEQLRHRAPNLVVLAYGTNESVEPDYPQALYERRLVDVLGRIARAVPTASCLLLGPPDRAIETKDAWLTSPKLVEIIASQKRVAEAAGCAFYDQMQAMGGEGSMATWAAEEPPRAQKDRVHLTKEGYQQLGSTFASDLMRSYAVWRRESGLPPTAASLDMPPAQPSPPPTAD